MAAGLAGAVEHASRGDGLVPRAERTGTDHWEPLLATDWTWGTATGRLAGEMAGRVLGRWPGLRPLPSRWRWWDGLDGGQPIAAR